MNTTSSRISNRRRAGGQQNRRPAQHGAASASKRYHHYCIQCGWGFTFAQFQTACFCPRCGRQVRMPGPLDSGHPSSPNRPKPWNHRQQGRQTGTPAIPINQPYKTEDAGSYPCLTWTTSPATPVDRAYKAKGANRSAQPPRRSFHSTAPHTSSQKPPAPKARPRIRRLTSLPERQSSDGALARGIQFAKLNPIAAGLAGAAAGAATMVAGSALVALGGSITTLSGCVTGLSAAGVVVAGLGAKNPRLAVPCLKGMGVGMAGMLAGGAITVGGQVLLAAGGVVAAGSGVLAVAGVAARIAKKLPNRSAKGLLANGSKAEANTHAHPAARLQLRNHHS